ncbi:hypothetical protein D3C78_1688950 [compost metagenome]
MSNRTGWATQRLTASGREAATDLGMISPTTSTKSDMPIKATNKAHEVSGSHFRARLVPATTTATSEIVLPRSTVESRRRGC